MVVAEKLVLNFFHILLVGALDLYCSCPTAQLIIGISYVNKVFAATIWSSCTYVTQTVVVGCGYNFLLPTPRHRTSH